MACVLEISIYEIVNKCSTSLIRSEATHVLVHINIAIHLDQGEAIHVSVIRGGNTHGCLP